MGILLVGEMTEAVDKPKKPRGFATMDKARVREIAKKGGLSCPPEKRSFSTNKELAVEAGRKGGKAFKTARELARQ